MKKVFLLMIVMATFICGNARVILFKDKDNVPVSMVRCTGFNAKMDSIASWTSNEKGEIDIKNAEVSSLLASHSGFNEKLVSIAGLTDNTIILSPSKDLKEVEVTPDAAKEFATYTSYNLSMKDMARYPNVLQSLNEIPFMTVLSNGGMFYQGDASIKVLINGIAASLPELRTISKEDVLRVDVYRNPPARFAVKGITAVIDIRLKSKIHGGNVGIDIDQAFYPLEGYNSASLYYNYKQSRFSVLLNNYNRHYKKYRQSEELDYTFDGERYNKTKEGLDSKTHWDNNTLQMGYQINIPKNFLYHVGASVGLNRNNENLKQKVTENAAGQSDSFLATNYLNTRYTRYGIRNYFEKHFKNGQSLLGNINYSHFSTGYESRYQEDSGSSAELQDSHSKYKTKMHSVFYEFQYAFPYSRSIGSLSLSVYGSYKQSKYDDRTLNAFSQSANRLGAVAYWSWWYKKKFSGSVRMGFQWERINTSLLTKANNLVIPTPSATVFWIISKPLWISVDYSYSCDQPSIAQLSETNQWLDNKLVYHGNSLLKPYSTHLAGIRFSYKNNYLNLSLRGFFKTSPNMICDMYTLKDDYMLQTLVNLDTYHELTGQLDMIVKPLGNNLLEFWTRVILAKVKGENKEYSWSGTRFQWMSTLSLNLEHWTAELYYQYPGKVASGQLIMPRTQAWSATLMYRPNTYLSFGVEWFMPFGKGMKESVYTVDSAPVYTNTELFVRDKGNMIKFKLSYNFSFGRNKNRARPQYDNFDDDSGILVK